MKRLIFHRNVQRTLDQHYGLLCPCWDTSKLADAKKCIFPSPDSVHIATVKKVSGQIGKFLYCQFQRYYGTSGAGPESKKKSRERVRSCTFCYHPQTLNKTTNWHCYRCNQIVNSKRENHRDCLFK